MIKTYDCYITLLIGALIYFDVRIALKCYNSKNYIIAIAVIEKCFLISNTGVLKNENCLSLC